MRFTFFPKCYEKGPPASWVLTPFSVPACVTSQELASGCAGDQDRTQSISSSAKGSDTFWGHGCPRSASSACLGNPWWSGQGSCFLLAPFPLLMGKEGGCSTLEKVLVAPWAPTEGARPLGLHLFHVPLKSHLVLLRGARSSWLLMQGPWQMKPCFCLLPAVQGAMQGAQDPWAQRGGGVGGHCLESTEFTLNSAPFQGS